MAKNKKARFASVIFSLLLALIVWAIYGIISADIGVTSFWGFGIGASIAAFFIFIMMGRIFGYWRALLATLGIIGVIWFAMLLNAQRSWPFGMVIFHDILGWQWQKVPWPLPIFWSAIIGGLLILKKPGLALNDPKILFGWAFDTALLTMILSLIIEPIARTFGLVTWLVQGAILGVPLSAFLGWFITAFIAAFAGMMILRPWNKPIDTDIHKFLPIIFVGFCGLIFIIATKQNIALVQILSGIYIIIFLLWTLRIGRKQDPNLIVTESTE
ncbi:carotenoid biosynthesis protein [Candidatus Uhrbacteria bacterium]|nr:carotenoid biosynthesis protein [Candidatus Uhrbacteria bacterium]